MGDAVMADHGQPVLATNPASHRAPRTGCATARLDNHAGGSVATRACARLLHPGWGYASSSASRRVRGA
jgi:hypothetical protein